MARGAKPGKAKGEGKRPVARKSSKNEGSRVRDLEKRLAESLKRENATSELLEEKNHALTEGRAQQTATAEILRLIGTSPTDAQPVFEGIARTGVRVLVALGCAVFVIEGDTIHVAATHGIRRERVERFRAQYPAPLTTQPDFVRTVREGIFHLANIEHNPKAMPEDIQNARLGGYRTRLMAPMTRGDSVLGTIAVTREAPTPFTNEQVALLKIFADQAVIAIENVRLFNELQERNLALTQAHAQVTESLEQQTATSEVLKVISRSAFDLQPVLETLVENAVRLCGADKGLIYRQDADIFRIAVSYGHSSAFLEVAKQYPIRQDRASATGRAVLERRAVHIHDILADPEYTWAEDLRAAEEMHRTILAVPMLRDGAVIGVIVIRRTQVLPFTDKQIELVTSFADQAVIAIENVRLFTELQQKNRALTDSHGQVIEALEQQTATSEILRVIASSPTGVQAVFDTIARNVVRLCNGVHAAVFRFDGELIHLVAHHNFTPQALVEFERAYPMRPTRESLSARAILDRSVVHVPDVEGDPDATASHRLGRATGYRSVLSVPMLLDGLVIGGISVGRAEKGPFSDRQIELVRTFADQAVIAIENVRLFTELEARNKDLTATSEVLQVISRSPTDVQPVFDTILANAARLCDAHRGALLLFRDGVFETGAELGTPLGLSEARKTPYRPEPHSHSLLARIVVERRAIFVPDLMVHRAYEEREPRTVAAVELAGSRSMLTVPLLKEDVLIGAITIHRPEPGPFSEEHISLLKTFADQAVIAIENVRLFKELEARNHDLTESLERQTATGEILNVISHSPTDVQPVFDTIVRSAVRLCDGLFSALYQFDGELIHQGAQHNYTPEALEEMRRIFPARPTRALVVGRAILERAVVHIPDVELDPEWQHPALSRAIGFRSGLFVPMLREGAPIGVIVVTRAEPRPFSDNEIELLKTFADQAVIAIENVRLFNELEGRNRDLTATSDILQVISRSPTDAQPVFDTIAERAMRLCDAAVGFVGMFDGALIHVRALANMSPEGVDAIHQAFPAPPSRGSAGGRVILTGDVVQIPDALEDPEYQLTGAARAVRFRGILGVPMLHQGRAIGVILVCRPEPGMFSEEQVQVLKTFADQAVIAIENVRLFTELETRNTELRVALEQQTATSDLLKVIGRSTFDLQPVFETLAESGVRLCGARRASIFRFDGQVLRIAATHNASAETRAFLEQHPIAPGRQSGSARAALERRTIHIHDAQSDPEYTYGVVQVHPLRTVLATPMLRADDLLGVIFIYREEVRPFSDSEIALLETFADQAAIAIENVRLFTELQEKNRALTEAHGQVTEALEQQTATGEILRVISQSPTAVQPVFDTIVQNARPLCGADSAAVLTYDGEQLQIESLDNPNPERADALRQAYPMPATRGHATGRAILTGRPVHIPDVREDPEYALDALRDTVGLRSLISVPLIREGIPIGAITVQRWATPRPFSDNQIDLLKTFADQAVIAIENVRLFKELEARTGELTESVETLTALGEVSHALSSTLDIEAVLNTIVSRASELAGAAGCSIYEYDEAAEQFELRATHNDDTEFVEALRATPLHKGEGLMGRAAEMREPIQIPDITQPGAYQSSVRDTLIRFGYRALLSVPLLREDQIIGSLSFNRKAPGEFSPEIVDVLKTFATQSALAIQNARLFHEIADKSRQLEAASRHKSEFLANMSHELRTPLNAIIGFSEVLAERMFGEVNAKQAEYLQDILESGRHLLSLINDILDLSKIEAGRMELEAADFDLASAIDNALILVRERATRRGITLGRHLDEGLGTIRGDERKVKQVLLNLLSNALKFTPEGGRIDVRAALHGGMAEVSVADTGVGIAPDDQAAVFEEFRQVGTAEKKVEGTGLGLALSQKFVELHGGRIWVESELGRGATFTFTLPVS